MKRKNRCFVLIALLCVLPIILCSCANSSENANTTENTSTSNTIIEATTEQAVTAGTDEKINIDTYITLDDENTSVKGNGAQFSKNVVTISKAGTYSISGKLSDGYIFVNTSDNKKVKLYLNGVSIYSSSNAPIFVENSPKETQIILAKNSVNNLADNADRKINDNGDYATASIYSKDDLQIEGHGKLNIAANFNKGIFSKNDIKICGGTINITSLDDAIRGKDSIEITAGTIDLKCGGDAIRTSNETDTDKGNITISGGKFNIESTLDAIQSVGRMQISGGSFNIKTAGGSANAEAKTNEFNKGRSNQRPNDSSMSEDENVNTPSTKGIKSEKSMNISGGSFEVDSLDDAFHSNTDLTVSGGTMKIKTNDDALHCENKLTIGGGKITVEQSYEGLEGKIIDISGGDIYIKSLDDGINSASDSSQNEASMNPKEDMPQIPDGQRREFEGSVPNGEEPPTGDFPHGGEDKNGFPKNGNGAPGAMHDYDSNCKININGGSIVIDASGDGIDSNGDITMQNGTLVIYGPTNGGNGALDYGGSFNMNGGTLLACGSAGMAQSVSGDVPVIHFNEKFEANTICTVTDSNGEQIISFASPKEYEDVVFASSELNRSSEYNILSGGKNSVESINGIFNGKTADAKQLISVTAS